MDIVPTAPHDVLLRGGRVIDPAQGLDGIFDVAVRDGRIKRGELLLLEAFGGGFTWGASLVRY